MVHLRASDFLEGLSGAFEDGENQHSLPALRARLPQERGCTFSRRISFGTRRLRECAGKAKLAYSNASSIRAGHRFFSGVLNSVTEVKDGVKA